MKEDIHVTSPTYTIIQTYQPHKGPEIWHMDFYRLNNSVDINDLDLDEAFSKAISIIEWPEKLDTIIKNNIRSDNEIVDLLFKNKELNILAIQNFRLM